MPPLETQIAAPGESDRLDRWPLPWIPEVEEERALAVLASSLSSDALVRAEEGELFVLSSGVETTYYVDAKRTVKSSIGFQALGPLIAAAARHFGATAVGGLTMGADSVADSALPLISDFKAFSVRKNVKEHGLERRIEGPNLNATDRCLVVDDVVTSGGSVLDAVRYIREEGFDIIAVLCVVDRLQGGLKRIRDEARVPVHALTTINDIYPDRPDRV